MSDEASAVVFDYTQEQHDKDATNARSAAYRTVRDGIGLPVDTEGKTTDEGKAIHQAAGAVARTVVIAVEKGLLARQKRDKWSEKVAKKAHLLLCKRGLAAYTQLLMDEGYEADENLLTLAMKNYGLRLIERRNLAEAAWKTQQESKEDMDSVFSSEDD